MPRLRPIALVAGTLLCCARIDAEPSPAYSLAQLLQRAQEHNADVAVARGRVDGARARLRQARAGFLLPRLRLESYSGLVPDAEGDIFRPPSDTAGVRPLGPFTRAELEFAQPLYTFGQLSSLAAAAHAGVEVERAALDETRLAVGREVKELYYGILLAQDLAGLARRLREELEKWEGEVRADDPDVPLSAPYKLQLALLELDGRERELSDKLRLARGALALKAGLPEGEGLQLAETALAPVAPEVPPLEALQQQALGHRPDWRRLRAGLDARRAQEQAARSAYLPQIFLAGGVRYAVAPGRTDQHNPFVRDEFNLFNGAIVLGVRQSFELGMLGADLDRARAERMQLEALERTAQQGLDLQVSAAHGEFRRAEAHMATALKARNLTREWVQLAREEFELDRSQIRELVSAFEGLAESEEAYYQAVYDYNVRCARLEQAVGMGLLPEVDAQP